MGSDLDRLLRQDSTSPCPNNKPAASGDTASVSHRRDPSSSSTHAFVPITPESDSSPKTRPEQLAFDDRAASRPPPAPASYAQTSHQAPVPSIVTSSVPANYPPPHPSSFPQPRFDSSDNRGQTAHLPAIYRQPDTASQLNTRLPSVSSLHFNQFQDQRSQTSTSPSFVGSTRPSSFESTSVQCAAPTVVSFVPYESSTQNHGPEHSQPSFSGISRSDQPATPPSPAPSPVQASESSKPIADSSPACHRTLPVLGVNSGILPSVNVGLPDSTQPNVFAVTLPTPRETLALAPALVHEHTRSVRFAELPATTRVAPVPSTANFTSATTEHPPEPDCRRRDSGMDALAALADHDGEVHGSHGSAPGVNEPSDYRPSLDVVETLRSSSSTIAPVSAEEASSASNLILVPMDWTRQQCKNCGSLWESTALMISPEVRPNPDGSITYSDSTKLQIDFHGRLREHRLQQDREYEAWIQRHVPAPRSCTDTTASTRDLPPDHAPESLHHDLSPQSSKRKEHHDPPASDGHLTTKLRRVTFDSPSPALCESTPPPDPPLQPGASGSGSAAASTSASASGSGSGSGCAEGDSGFVRSTKFSTAEGPVYITKTLYHTVEERSGLHNPAPNDWRNMWTDIEYEKRKERKSAGKATSEGPPGGESSSKGKQHQPPET